MPRPPLYLVAFNEVNFAFVRHYVGKGELPAWAALIATHGVTETRSAEAESDVEPWLQWPTVHTGLTPAEHRCRHLGDAAQAELVQIWDHLEARHGCRVGAVMPINATNVTRRAAFFVPDPWTSTPMTGDPALRRLYTAARALVVENATGRAPLGAYAGLVESLLRYAPRGGGLAPALRQAVHALRDRSARAILLDLLLTDVFESQVRRHRPDFASLFLNAAAHLQHHYLLASPACGRANVNPDWYLPAGSDPVLDAFRAYDRILARLMKLAAPGRLLIATGLQQVPVATPVFYWRLVDPAAFLSRIGAPAMRVEPRMARDFRLVAGSVDEARRAAAALAACRCDGRPLFELEAEGTSLSVTLAWDRDIPAGTRAEHAGGILDDLRRHVAFVAIKNGRHDGTGYLVDTGAPASGPIALASIFDRIDAHFAGRAELRRAA